MTSETLQVRLDGYLELRRALGYKTSVHQHVLRDFADYVATHGQPGPIRAATTVDWARQASARCYRTGAAGRLWMVRGFLMHLKAFEPETEIPSPGLVAEPRRPQAHLYSPEQINRMMEAGHHWFWEPGSFRQATYRTVIGLLASTGLRIGEALRLMLDQAHLDHDPPYLEIRDTKFHKNSTPAQEPSAHSSSTITAAPCATTWSARRFCMLKRTLRSSKKKALGARVQRCTRCGIRLPSHACSPGIAREATCEHSCRISPCIWAIWVCWKRTATCRPPRSC